MDSSVNPQPTDAHIRISHEIHRELIRRKFSQRQRNVIDFILTLSWGCGKPSAIIPELKNFQEAGIGSNHIRQVLDGLVAGNVILWDQLMNIFQVNKHYDQWEIDIVSSSAKKFKELINMNLARPSPNLLKPSIPKKGNESPEEEPGSPNGNPVPEKGSVIPKREPSSGIGNPPVPEKGNEFPKKEPPISQKGKRTVPRKGNVRRDYPSHIKGFSVSKASIKAIFKSFKRTTTTTITTREPLDLLEDADSFQSAMINYSNNFLAGKKVAPFDEEDMKSLFDDFGGAWLHAAMRTAYRGGPEKQNLAYIRGILNGYQHRGGTTSQQSEKTDASFISPGKPKTPNGSGRNTSRSGKQQIPISVDDGSGDVPTPEEMAEMMRKAQEIKDAKVSVR
ncbi:replication protein [Paenibacillus sp. FSL L8-0463]|uniref:replication protein n=1 Tax=Paenibacillus sp. FSL L8-0463 TaxID=2954687 RepID=UPI003119F8D6